MVHPRIYCAPTIYCLEKIASISYRGRGIYIQFTQKLDDPGEIIHIYDQVFFWPKPQIILKGIHYLPGSAKSHGTVNPFHTYFGDVYI
jgi:hypothetical protein